MSRFSYNIAGELYDPLENQNCRIGLDVGFKLRVKYPFNVVKPTLTIPLPAGDCYITVDIMRTANSAGTGFYYGTTYECISYQKIGGVVTYLGSDPYYNFASGAVMVLTNTLTANQIVLSFSQIVHNTTIYMAAYGTYKILPIGFIIPPRVSDINPGAVIRDYFNQTSFGNILSLWPYRQYFKETKVSVAGTYDITPNIPLDSFNGENSTMFLRISICMSQNSTQGVNANLVGFCMVQGGSFTIPAYSMIIRNLTLNYSVNSASFSLGTVGVTGNVNTPPAVRFTAGVTVTELNRICVRVECVCATHDDANYI